MTSIALLILFSNVTQTYSLPEGLISAICYTESRHKTHALNPKDGLLRNGERSADPSIGMCQLKLDTAQQFEPNLTAKNLLNPKVNVRVAAKFLQWQLRRYDGGIPCAIAAYNGGSCRYNKHGQIKNRKYVYKVMKAWLDGK